MNKKKSKKGIALITLGSVAMLIAVGLLIYNSIIENIAENVVQKSLMSLNSEIENIQLVSSDVLIPDEMETVTIDGLEYIGKISIPSLNRELPVLKNWSYDNLTVSPCRYKGNLYNNSLIVIAHNYRNHFGQLKNLTTGEKVFFTDVKCHVYSFIVTECILLDGTDVEKMEDGNWDLTLFTCTYGGRQRVTVRCERCN